MNITFIFSDLNILGLCGSPFQPTKKLSYIIFYLIETATTWRESSSY